MRLFRQDSACILHEEVLVFELKFIGQVWKGGQQQQFSPWAGLDDSINARLVSRDKRREHSQFTHALVSPLTTSIHFITTNTTLKLGLPSYVEGQFGPPTFL